MVIKGSKKNKIQLLAQKIQELELQYLASNDSQILEQVNFYKELIAIKVALREVRANAKSGFYKDEADNPYGVGYNDCVADMLYIIKHYPEYIYPSREGNGSDVFEIDLDIKQILEGTE